MAAMVVAFTTAVTLGALQTRAEAPTRPAPAVALPVDPATPIRPNPLAEFRNVKIPSVQWIMAKAQCETNTDWANRGIYGGAFGFMHRGYETDNSGLPNNSSWGRWGGFTYAKHPSKATPTEQVIVYLRINYAGWHRPNGMFRKPSSPNTDNNCYQFATKVAGGHKLRVRNIEAWYAEFQRITYLRWVAKN